jgi:hypothetical protein
MNVAEAIEALNASADRVLNFAQLNNWQSEGTFALFVQDCDERSVKASQDRELESYPDQPLMATAGMTPGSYAVLAQLVTTGNQALDLAVSEAKGDQMKVWMSTHVAERTTQAEFVAAAKGRVLVAGLGLGLVLGPLLAKPEVTEVVVIDINPEVELLLGPYLKTLAGRDRLHLIQADVLGWRCPGMFDTIYFDIWPNISARNLAEMLKLERRYAKHLRAGGWMGCWAKAECVEMLKRESKRFPQIAKLYDRLVKEFGIEAEPQNICFVTEGA